MPKRFDATDMLGRGRQPRAAQSTTPLEDEPPGALVVGGTSALGTLTTGAPGGKSAESAETGRQVAQSETYERMTVYLTPDQKRWVKNSAKALPVDGLSSSDIVRLAIMRLRHAINGGDVKLVEALTEQAHEEAQRLTGRRNRGLPTLTETARTYQ